MIKFETNDSNVDLYTDLVDWLNDIVGNVISMEEFVIQFPKYEVFVEVTNNHCYRSGSIEQYIEVDDRVFYLDEDNSDVVELLITKDNLIKQYESVLS
jgi:hypothetical protein